MPTTTTQNKWPPAVERERQRALAVELARELGATEAQALGSRARAEALREVGDADADRHAGRSAAMEAACARLSDVLGVLVGAPPALDEPPPLPERVAAYLAAQPGDRARVTEALRPAVAGLAAGDPETRHAACAALWRGLRGWEDAAPLVGELAALRAALRAELPKLDDCDATLAEAEQTVGDLGDARVKIGDARLHLRSALAAGAPADVARHVGEALRALGEAGYPGGRPQALVEATMRHLERLQATASDLSG